MADHIKSTVDLHRFCHKKMKICNNNAIGYTDETRHFKMKYF